MSDGDITKRRQIIWESTSDDCKPYLEARQRQRLFREAVIAFLGADQDTRTEEQQAYCAACKQAGFDDCENCNPAEIGKIDG